MTLKNPIQTLRRLHAVFSRLPGGRSVLSGLFSFFVPYSGSVSPEILELRPGLVKIRMQDRRKVRNHLSSVHAIAMANLAEATTGLAVSLALPDHKRAILTELTMQYLKKGRGALTGICRFELPADFHEGDVAVESDLVNQADEVVARARVTWRIGLSR